MATERNQPSDPLDEPGAIRTTAGDVFTKDHTAMLAFLIFLRFGKNEELGHTKYMRLLSNNCTVNQYMKLVERGAMISSIRTRDREVV